MADAHHVLDSTHREDQSDQDGAARGEHEAVSRGPGSLVLGVRLHAGSVHRSVDAASTRRSVPRGS